jgi:hypothetical protein
MLIDIASLPVSSELQLCFYTLCESIIPDLIEVKGKLKKENNGHLDIFSRTKMRKYLRVCLGINLDFLPKF